MTKYKQAIAHKDRRVALGIFSFLLNQSSTKVKVVTQHQHPSAR